jgi:hypothetical protein
MVLRDSFMQNEKCKILMLACINPGISSGDHTLNTLRYAERLKERQANAIQTDNNVYDPEQLEHDLGDYMLKNGKEYISIKEQQHRKQQEML